MWQADDAVSKTGDAWSAGGNRPASATEAPATPPQPGTESRRPQDVGSGRSVRITGELKATEDLTIDGQVDGKIELAQNSLTVGVSAKIRAEIFAKTVIVLGEVTGNITATEKVEVRADGAVEGDVRSPRLVIADGAHVRGRIEMDGGPARVSGEARGPDTTTTRRPETASGDATGGGLAGLPTPPKQAAV